MLIPSCNPSTNGYSLITLNLYRLFINHKIDNEIIAPYLIWGYFDRLSITFPNAIEDLLVNNDIDENINEKNLEIHKIHLFTKDYSQKELESFFDSQTPNPIIVITELKINEKIFEINKSLGNGPTLLDIKQKLITMLSKNNSFDSILLSSLSYSDFVIIFKGKSYQKIIDAIHKIRRLYLQFKNVEKGKFRIGIFQTSYSISGIKINEIDELCDNEKLDISLRLSLKKSCSTQKINNCLKEFSPKVSTVFGKYDLDILFRNISLKEYAKIFADSANSNNIFSLQNQFHKDYIAYTNTRFLLKVSDRQKPSINFDKSQEFFPPDSSKIMAALPPHVPEAIQTSMVLKNAYSHLLKNYYQLEKNEASESAMLYELNTIITTFIDQINKSEKIIGTIKDEGDKMQAWEDQYISIQKGIQVIDQLMNSRIQAFRFYSEIPFINSHQILGSSKIYNLYMALVEEIEIAINNYYRNQLSSNVSFNFFVTLNEFDDIETGCLFPQFDYKLIPIQLSKNSFFDLYTNIFYLFHEISHYMPCTNYTDINNCLTQVVTKELIKKYISSTVVKNEILVSNSFTSLDQKLLNDLEKSFSEFYYQKIWENIENNKKNIPIEQFAEELLYTIKLFSLPIDRNISDISQKISDKAFGSEIKDFDLILSSIMEKISCHDDYSFFWEQFQYKLDALEAEEKNEEKRQDLLYIKNKWKELNSAIKEKNKLLTGQWLDYIKTNIFSIIDEYKKDIRNTELCENYLVLLSQTSILENNELNAKIVINSLLDYFNSNQFHEESKSIINKNVRIIKDIIADFSMCYMLDLCPQQYSSLIDKHYSNYRNRSLFPDPELPELMVRERVINHTRRVFLDHGQDDTEILLAETGLFSVVNFLDQLSNSMPIINEIIHLPFMKQIRDYFKKYDTSGLSDKKTQNETNIELIEYFWLIGFSH